MHKTSKKTEARITADMFRLFEERGPQSETDLLAAGFTPEEIATCGPKVAQLIRERETAAA